MKKSGFLLVESLFELIIISILIIIVLAVFARTMVVLKESMTEIKNINIVENECMEMINIAKSEMLFADFYIQTHSKKRLTGKNLKENEIGFEYNLNSKKLYRYAYVFGKGKTYLGSRIEDFKYDNNILKINVNDVIELKLYIPNKIKEKQEGT